MAATKSVRNNDVQSVSKRLLSATALTAVGMAMLASSASAQNWTDHTAVVGDISIDTTVPSTTNITQHTDFARVNGNGDINAGWTVNLYQPGSSSIYALYDTKGDPTRILGTLNANGQVYVFDQNGVIFGTNSRIDVGSLVVSTGHISDADIINNDGKLTITDLGDAKIELNGSITVSDAGIAAFVSPYVSNNGVINAKMGKVALAAGEKVTLDLYGDNLIEIAVEDKLSNALLENAGTINAQGGTVAIRAEVAKQAVENVINMSGVINASSASVEGGKIVLGGGSAGAVQVSGTLDASGTNGGTVSVTGQNVYVADTAQLNVDGGKGADQKGNGGRVDVIAQDHADYRGSISAKGGEEGGNGGSAEVSGYGMLGYTGSADLSASKGDMGNLLLDPAFVIIHSGYTHNPLGGGYVLADWALANSMKTANITVQADNFIDVGLRVGSYNTGNSTIDTVLNTLAGSEEINLRDYGTWSTFFGFPVAYTVEGTTAGGITFQADTINFNKDVIMGNGNVAIDGNTVNLDSRLYAADGTTALGDARISSNAGEVNVLSNNALIQQGVWMANDTGASTVTVADGDYNESVLINKSNLKLVSENGRGNTSIIGSKEADKSGTIHIAPNANNVQVGDIDQGFTLVGYDTTNPGSEEAVVYLQGAHDGVSIIGNELVANGEAGLLTEYGLVNNNILIDSNIFSGQTFTGANPATGNQFTVHNVPRALVYLSGNNGGSNNTNITISNNDFTAVVGGKTVGGADISNSAVTVDAHGAAITGNNFASTVTGSAFLLRTRGTDTDISGNTFDAANLAPNAGYLHASANAFGTPSNMTDVYAANTFINGKSVYANNYTADQYILQKIQPVINAAAAGATVTASAGTFEENVTINKALTLLGASRAATIIKGPTTGNGISFNANDINVRELTVDGFQNALYFNTNVSDIFMRNVTAKNATRAGLYVNGGKTVTNLKTNNVRFENNVNGVFIRGSVDGLDMYGGVITGSNQGFLATFNGAPDDGSFLKNVSLRNITFTNNALKGLYIEKLSDAVLKDLDIRTSGTTGTSAAAGLDINLKHQDFSNITLDGTKVRTSATGESSNAITVKARNDGSYVTDPGKLTGLVIKNSDVVTTGGYGIAIGNDIYDIELSNNTVSGATNTGILVYGTGKGLTLGNNTITGSPKGMEIHMNGGTIAVNGVNNTNGGTIDIVNNATSFDQAITIANNASLTSGGGNIKVDNKGASGGFITLNGNGSVNAGTGDVLLNARQLRLNGTSAVTANNLTTNGALVEQLAGSKVTANKLTGTLTSNANFAGINNAIKEIGNFITGTGSPAGGFFLNNASGQKLEVTGKIATDGGDVVINHNNRLDVTSTGSIVTEGGDVALTVLPNAFIYADGLIDTRDAAGNGAVTLSSGSNIEMRNGGKIYGGLVTLNSGNIINQASGASIDADRLEGSVDKDANLNGTANAIREIGNFTTGAHAIASVKGGFDLINSVTTKIVGNLLGGNGDINLTVNGDVDVVSGGTVNAEGGNVDIKQTGIFKSVANAIKTLGTGTINVEQRAGGSINQAVQSFDNTGTGLNTALIHDGAYNENVLINDSNVLLISENGRDHTVISGDESYGGSGTVQLASNTNNVQVGDIGKGFTINGFDITPVGVDIAAVYIQGAHDGVRIIDNEIVANGEGGVTFEEGYLVNNVLIDSNIFSGQTFVGPTAGQGGQYVTPNYPRQLLAMGGGLSSNVTVTNNQFTGKTGSENFSNFGATIDSNGAVISGNTFAAEMGGFNYQLRTRGQNTNVFGNTFDGSKMSALSGYYFADHDALGTPSTIPAVFAANTFINGNTVYASDYTGNQMIHRLIQPVINAASAGANVYVSAGEFVEQLDIGKNLSLLGAGVGQTILKSPKILANNFVQDGRSNYSIIYAHDAGSINISGFEIDGSTNENTGLNDNARFVGVSYFNAGGDFANNAVKNITTAGNTKRTGFGLFATAKGKDSVLNITDNEFSNFQTFGLAIADGRLSATVKGNDISSTNTGYQSGIFAYGLKSLTIGGNGSNDGNTISSVRNGIESEVTRNAVIEGNDISNVTNGMVISGANGAKILGNSIVDATTVGLQLKTGSQNVTVADNFIEGSATGILADRSGAVNGLIFIRGNELVDNNVGMHFKSGVIDLGGDANDITGGTTGIIFDPTTANNASALSLLNKTIGSTNFNGQSGNYITLLNTALFNPDQPTRIDAINARFDGVSASDFVNNVLTQQEIDDIEDKIWHYTDDNTLGMVRFRNSVPVIIVPTASAATTPTDDVDQENVFFFFTPENIQSSSFSMTINGMPSTGVPGNNPPSAQSLNNISPNAGEMSPADLNEIAPAAGNEPSNTTASNGNAEPTQVACWEDAAGQAGAGIAININYGGGLEGALSSAAACGSDV
jgi:filamentous hemagglutinin family protein